MKLLKYLQKFSKQLLLAFEGKELVVYKLNQLSFGDLILFVLHSIFQV